MSERHQITIDIELRRRARAKASERGISFAEYVRRLLVNDLGEEKRQADISEIFDLVTDGPPVDIGRDKDKLIGEAVWQNYKRKTGRLKTQRTRRKAGGR